MRFLVLCPNYERRYNWTFETFRWELSRQAECVFAGPGYPEIKGGTFVPELIKYHGPFDFVLIPHIKYAPKHFKGFDEVTVSKLTMPVDYLPRCYDEKNRILVQLGADVLFSNQGFGVAAAKAAKRRRALPDKLRIVYLPFCVDTDIFKRSNNMLEFRPTDVMALFTTVPVHGYPMREKIVRKLVQTDLDVVARGANNTKSRITHLDYINQLNTTKAVVTTSASSRSVGLRYFEAPACGALLFGDWANDLDRLGFKDEENFVQFYDPDDLIGKLRFYLNNASEWNRITQAAYDLIYQRHTTRTRVSEFLDFLRNKL